MRFSSSTLLLLSVFGVVIAGSSAIGSWLSISTEGVLRDLPASSVIGVPGQAECPTGWSVLKTRENQDQTSSDPPNDAVEASTNSDTAIDNMVRLVISGGDISQKPLADMLVARYSFCIKS